MIFKTLKTNHSPGVSVWAVSLFIGQKVIVQEQLLSAMLKSNFLLP